MQYRYQLNDGTSGSPRATVLASYYPEIRPREIRLDPRNADVDLPHQNKHFRNVFITCFICILFTAGVDHP